MLRITCLIIIIFICAAGYSQPASKPGVLKPTVIKKAVLVTDTSVITQRQFDTTKLNAYKKLPEFTYHENHFSPSLWERFWNWFWGLFNFKNPKVSSGIINFLKYFFITAGVGAIIFLVLKLAGINVLNTFRGKPKVSNLAYEESAENIHEIDFDTEIEQAASVHNYRLAVRMLYLKTLKQLSDKGLIEWQPNKTNTTYVNELTDTAQRETFKQLTRQFEYVWYGDFSVNGDIFRNISLLFQNFKAGKA